MRTKVYRRLRDLSSFDVLGIGDYPSTTVLEHNKLGRRVDMDHGFYLRAGDRVYNLYPNISLFAHRMALTDLFFNIRKEYNIVLMEDLQYDPSNLRHSDMYVDKGIVVCIVDPPGADELPILGFNYNCFQENLNRMCDYFLAK